MTEPKSDPDAKAPWHTGLWEPRIWIVTIVGGVVTTILVTQVIFPGLSAVSRSTLAVIGSISQKTVDAAYVAAVTHPEYIFFKLAFSMVAATITSFTAIITFITVFRNLIMRIILSNDDESEEFPTYIKLISRITDILLWITAPLMVSLLFVVLTLTSLSFEIAQTFERRMLILSPYISDQQSKILSGEWGGISSKSDFDRLMRQTDTIASSHNVVLPKRADS